MTSDIIQAAIGALRASVEALPAEYRGPWHGSHTVVSAGSWPDYAFTVGAPIAEHLALTASPHVTEALIAHLESFADLGAVLLAQAERGAAGLRDHEIAERMTQRREAHEAIERTLRALAEAITHRSGT